jgi:hypothetical protein
MEYRIVTLVPEAVPDVGGVSTNHGTSLETLQAHPAGARFIVYEPVDAAGPNTSA